MTSTPSTSDGPTAAPADVSGPSIENFMLKDLDTGMKSYVTDQEWVEKPIMPPGLQPQQTGFKSTNKTPNPMASSSTHRPPISKRARSDELQSISRTLQPADHVRVIAHKKRDRDFSNLYRWQCIRAHNGCIRVIEFNRNCRYLASAGADAIIKIWEIDYKLEDSRLNALRGSNAGDDSEGSGKGGFAFGSGQSAYMYIRNESPVVKFKGHTSDVTTLSWSKNNFLLSGSVDKTIRLWHPEGKGCIRRLIHPDVVTCVAFHPNDEQICLAGRGDGTVNMWHLKERKILSEVETDDLVTACAITPDGTTALVGTYHGRCKFYRLFDEIQTEWQFKHTTQLDVRSRKAKNAQGKKICGFRFYGGSDMVMVSSNDSRLRMYRLSDKAVVSKFLGHQNNLCHLNASFSPKGKYVLCASESKSVHIWEIDNQIQQPWKPPRPTDDNSTDDSNGRKDRAGAHESFIVNEQSQVTAAVFAPREVPPDAFHLQRVFRPSKTIGLVIVTASDDGELRVFGCSY